MSDVEKPDWLVEGAKVLAYSMGGATTPESPRVTAVKKIATASFTLEHAQEPRFRLQSLTAHVGGTWGHTRTVVSLESDAAREVIQREKDRRRMVAARNAVDKWQMKRTHETRLAAIAALQAIEQDEEPGS